MSNEEMIARIKEIEGYDRELSHSEKAEYDRLVIALE
jgi:hypothetical protein